jgi:hypothetical protein
MSQLALSGSQLDKPSRQERPGPARLVKSNRLVVSLDILEGTQHGRLVSSRPRLSFFVPINGSRRECKTIRYFQCAVQIDAHQQPSRIPVRFLAMLDNFRHDLV